MTARSLVLRHRAVLRTAVAVAATSALGATAAAQLPTFSGAEGFGGTFNGTMPANGWFSTAEVYHVTTTQDLLDAAGKPQQGTLRGAFWNYTQPTQPKQNASNRIVVFDVGGLFNLTQGSLDIKTVDRLYVAGQTAPSPVIIYGDTTQITKSNNTVTQNLALRYMTFRKGTGGGEDAITFAGGSGTGTIATNMILDHVSASWAEDENLSVANNNTNVTVQYSINADALTSGHAYGSLVRPQVDSSVSFHHNLYANNVSRQPRLGTYNDRTLTMDFVNNVVYNWRDRAGYAGGSSEAEQEHVDLNYVGNYLVAGPGTLANVNRAFLIDKNVDVRAYQNGNKIDSDKTANPGGVPNGVDTGWGMFSLSEVVVDQTFQQMNAPFAVAPVTTQSADDAYSQVISYAGNSWWARDAIDSRIIGNVTGFTSPALGAAAPINAELTALLATPTVSRAAGFDTDRDGMPDAWELQMGLNPNNAADGKLDFDNDQYTNVEEYLNELGAFPAPAAIKFDASLNSRYARIENWDIPFQPSRFDTVQINSGTAVVDAIGQDAGAIQIGAAGASPSALTVSSGWLRVVNNVTVGVDAASSASLNLTGGTLVVAGTIGGGAGANNAVNFTGGTLIARGINATNLAGGTFTQSGGTFSPGTSSLAGRTSVVGNFTVAAGTVEMQLGGSTAASSFQENGKHDAIDVSGNATLGGALALATLGYDPAKGVSHEILTAGSITGHFATVSGHQLATNKWLAVTYTGGSVLVTAATPGDANVDGAVNFNDLLALAKKYGQNETTWADGDFSGNGTTSFEDLLTLAKFYGTSSEQFAADWALAQSMVPEPIALTSLMAMSGVILRRVRNN